MHRVTYVLLVEHYDLPTAQEEDIFKRIQQGMTLNTGGQLPFSTIDIV
jgi:hypothetical protein